MYSYDRRVFAYDADNGLRSLQYILVKLSEDGGKLLNDLENPEKANRAAYHIAYLVKSIAAAAIRANLYGLFLHILQTYNLSAKDRKVIEKGAKFFNKKSVRTPSPEKALAAYISFANDMKEYYLVVKRILDSGTKHEEGGEDSPGTILKAGPFTLVNTGGFDAKTMETTVKVVEKAAQMIAHKGLSKICYGPVQVTKTITRSTRTLAFYMVKDDSLFLRANIRGQTGPAIQSVLHELGHRLQFKFLNAKKNEINALYRTLQGKKQEAALDSANWPEIGSEIQLKNQVVVVDRVLPHNGLLRVHLKDDPRVTGTVSLDPYLKKSTSQFVSRYAETDPDENFAEMFAEYCLDTLSDELVQKLEAIIK